jgi:glycosyltransferase involved in cell wall biosynthesis
LPKQHVVVIPNAVNTDEIRQKASETVIPPWLSNVPAVITVGRLTLAKGQWHLIRAFAASIPEVQSQLVILGAGEMESTLRRLVKQLGIEQHVFFLGWQSNPFKYLSRADLFVLTSLTEAFGLVLLEAMTCGLPVISADCPSGPREILAPGLAGASVRQPHKGEFGVLVPAFDDQIRTALEPLTSEEQSLASAIVRMVRDSSLRARYVDAGAVRVRDFDHAAFIAQYQDLFSKLAASKSRNL